MRAIASLAWGALVVLSFVPGCGGSAHPTPPVSELIGRLTGDYVRTVEVDGGSVDWLRLGPEGSCVRLYEHPSGLRRPWAGAWSITDPTLSRVSILSGAYVATLTDHDSTLTLVSDHENDTFVFRRTSGFPDPNHWVREIRILETFDPPSTDTYDLAWDGIGLWFPDSRWGRLRRMDLTDTLSIDRDLDVAHAVGEAIAHVGRTLWYADPTGRLYQVDDSSGVELAAPGYVAPRPVRGLAVDQGRGVWVSGGRLDRIDAVTGEVTESLDLGFHTQVGHGLEFAGNRLYLANGSFGIARVTDPPRRVDASWFLPSAFIHGLGFDGQSWWILYVDTSGNVTTRLARAELLDTDLTVVSGK